jgi:hypothetical protein
MVSIELRGGCAARLRGWALTVARAGWLAFFGVAVLTFLAAVPVRWARLVEPSAITLANLQALGLPVGWYAVYLLTLELIFTGAYLAVGGMLFWRRADDRMAWLASLFLVAYGVGNQTITPVVEALRGGGPALDFLVNTLAYAAWASFGCFLYMFPTGRFIPAWARWLAWVWLLFCIPYNYAIGTPLHPVAWPAWLGYPVTLAFWISWLGGQVYRYQRISTALERQQTKWVLFGLACVIVVVVIEVAAFALFPGTFDPAWLMGKGPTTPSGLAFLIAWLGVIRLAFLSLPITIAFSILRYRLFDIDRLINRALVYVVLTGSLGLVYLGSVLILESALGALSGQAGQSPLAIVASTLAIAALFSPLRRRVQDFIDRRFYRRKYDAARTLAEFAATARDETDLDRLAARLTEVTVETIQPAGVSLWLRPGAKR